jgi:hypothetical protein
MEQQWREAEDMLSEEDGYFSYSAETPAVLELRSVLSFISPLPSLTYCSYGGNVLLPPSYDSLTQVASRFHQDGFVRSQSLSLPSGALIKDPMRGLDDNIDIKEASGALDDGIDALFTRRQRQLLLLEQVLGEVALFNSAHYFRN